MNIVLGSNGLLGKTLQEREFFKNDWVFLDKSQCDITNYQQIKSCVGEYSPNIIINCAAYTDVTKAQTEKKECSNINHWGVKNICSAISDNDHIKLIHISTNFVFWGDKSSPYTEYDICAPINHYGLSKVMGEQVIMSMLRNYLILRTSWLFGYQKENFLTNMINLLSTKDKIVSPVDMISVPTSSSTLAKAIERFIEIDGNSLYNVVSNNPASAFDYVSEIKRLSATPCIIEPTTYSDYQQFPLRPKYSVLSTKKIEALFENEDNWKITLQNDINKLIDAKLLEISDKQAE